jgi:Family of unknown function (DUF6428)
MKNVTSLNWHAFKEALMQHPQLTLQFQYAENKWIDASYHITEVKQAPIVAVDCGGVMNKWTEIIVQLWEPGTTNETRAMKVEKALSIIEVVEKMLPLDAEAAVKIEFGNSDFDTRQMYPGEINIAGDNLVIDLRPATVQCKALERGGSCGTTPEGEECCTPVVKQEIKLKNLATAAPCCEPGCC